MGNLRWNLTYPAIELFHLASTATPGEVSSMNKNITIWDLKLEVWGEAVRVTHAHEPKLQGEGNNVSRQLLIKIKGGWQMPFLRVICNAEHL